ncbi:MAG: crossover junction endodeoxyribonuclease RuvC [Chloroflexi bacterium]|nr:crossover junction endodeoxyribonuclease RuvC [Chloroflexota bacterium]
MRIIGIDPGTYTMGYGILQSEGGEITCLACGAITVPRGLPLPERLRRLHGGLLALLECYAPQTAAVEEPFVAKNPRSALAVGQGMAIALLAAAQRGIDIARYPPAKVKGAVAGHGQSSKARVQQLVRLQLGLAADPEPPDAADALAVALCHLQERRLQALRDSG